MDILRNISLLLLLLVSIQVNAQRTQRIEFDAKQKAFLEEQALARVRTFQENCAKVGSKSNSKSEKELTIKETLRLFVDNLRTIQVTNSDGSVQRPKKIEIYLTRLMLLGYKEIEITSSDFHISTDLKPSASMNAKYPGEDWYEGVCSVIQHFRAKRFEYEYIDTVKREFTVYLRKVEIYEGAEKNISWQVFIGDIQAHTISVGF